MVSIDKQLTYRSIIHISSQNKGEIFKGLDKILRKYNSEGFTIAITNVENLFKVSMDKVKEDLYVTMNYANMGDYVTDIEQNNRTVR